MTNMIQVCWRWTLFAVVLDISDRDTEALKMLCAYSTLGESLEGSNFGKFLGGVRDCSPKVADSWYT